MSYDESLVPSSELAGYVGSGTDMENFRIVGEAMLQWLVHLGGLRSSDKVLEVGCGIGRIAIPLTQYLQEGSYDGFDIVRHGIEWCQQKITAKYPQFRFLWADLYNKTYNPAGKQRAAQYRFPYADRCFDFVFLTSVFTHMLPADLQHYLAEINRVLKRGGTCFFTAYLIDEEARRHMGTSKRQFTEVGGYWTINLHSHEDGLGYDQALFIGWLTAHGFAVKTVEYGRWWEKESAQDIIVTNKI
jgi:SAM-dependent methyltransferase